MEIVKPTESRQPADPLSDRERTRRDELETIVTDTLRRVFDCGFALREIQENKYHRETHARFEDYVESRFGFSRQTAYRMINAATVMENVTHGLQNPPIGADISPLLPLPTNERQARPLALLPADDQIVVWQTAVQTAPKGKITAAHIRKVVNDKLGKPPARRASRIKQRVGELPENFKTAFQAITEIVFTARRNKFQGVDRKKMVEILDSLKRLIEG